MGIPAAALAVFAKAPLAGRAKTRLGAALGAHGAAEFQRECVHSIWGRLASHAGIEAFLYCDERWPEFEELAGAGRFRKQSGAGLGERMRACLEELLGSGYAKALIVGSDAPTIPLAQVDEALLALDEADVVIGPAEDGGFTLVGAVRTDPAMFRGVTWSRKSTRSDCLRALRAGGPDLCLRRGHRLRPAAAPLGACPPAPAQALARESAGGRLIEGRCGPRP